MHKINYPPSRINCSKRHSTVHWKFYYFQNQSSSPLALTLSPKYQTYHYFNFGSGSTMWDENRRRGLTAEQRADECRAAQRKLSNSWSTQLTGADNLLPVELTEPGHLKKVSWKDSRSPTIDEDPGVEHVSAECGM